MTSCDSLASDSGQLYNYYVAGVVRQALALWRTRFLLAEDAVARVRQAAASGVDKAAQNHTLRGEVGTGPASIAAELPPRLESTPARLDRIRCSMHDACMSTKTISLKLEAYERLKAAKSYPGESFSEVVLRAHWPESTISGAELRTMCHERGPTFDTEALDRIDRLKERDEPPEDKWAKD